MKWERENIFDIWKFVKGRRRATLFGVSWLLGFLISDSHAVGVIAGGLVESLWGLGEWYFKK